MDSRGKLRVYLGAAPGVGKTYAMLDEAQRRVARGTDVVVGVVETHGRENTAKALAGLEVVPRRSMDYRGTTYLEMDLDGVLARRPEVVLVDELAHTNIGGSLHEKRWQDVEAILAAGIHVITTVNIQHLESLNDVVEAITGQRQRETVPDRVVRQADAIELVDMSPQALRRRMAHGNIYSHDKVDAALGQYFREGNLAALRELALLWLADRVDEGLDQYREKHEIDSTWATRERIVVALTGGPESAALLRRAARIASRGSGGEWMALYVARRDGLSGVTPDQLLKLRRTTEDLGGTLHTVVGDDTATAILDFARAENASQVIIGASRRGRLSTLLRPGVGELVIAASGDIDAHVVTHDYARRKNTTVRASSNLSRGRLYLGYAFGILAPLVASELLVLTDSLHGLPTEAMVLMAVVVGTALVGGIVPAIIAAVVSSLALNLVFTPPLWSLTIADPENAFAIGLFLVVGIAVASVVDRAARNTVLARKARAESDALTVLAHSLLHAGDDVETLLASACELFGARGAAVFGAVDGRQEVMAASGAPPASLDSADVTVSIDESTTLALCGRRLDASDRRLLKAYAAHAAVLAERTRAHQAETERAQLAVGNKTRTALLAAVSHDLRSPLAAVKAAAGSLRNTDIRWSPDDEAQLLETIEDSADRLNALVANLLDMSRIQTGAVRPTLTEVDLDDTVHQAIGTVAEGSRIAVRLDESLVALADPGLLERVVANICENAIKYSPPPAPITVDGSRTSRGVVIRIADSGPGIAEENHERLFAPFQRLGDVPAGDGVGLGLAVAQGLTEAMGGTLTAEDTPGGGLTFVLELTTPQEQS
ncbi:ATP-binding protein [Aeromicrobium yanjiei]|uniref:ATP-binding protein n=1 Tax=Aeromicrobium yanjiei TaxID=2662028 RepID=UPI002E2741C9